MTDEAEVATIAGSIARHGSMAFDIEFVSADRFIPELSLIQVAWGRPDDPEVAAIDCLAVDPGPILALVADPGIMTIAHAARQDLGLLAVRFDITARDLWDTQIAAAFAGLGDQIGYAKLAHKMLGVRLDKGQQFTAWLERPLSPAQLRYALDDVRFLLPLWYELENQLEEQGRLQWVGEESDRLCRSVGPLPPADEAYREVKGWRGLRGKALGSLRSLAAWRQTEALARNKPLSWLLPARAMIDVCRTGARNERDLRQVRGIGDGTTRRHGEAILQAIAEGRRTPPPEEQPEVHRSQSSRAQAWATIIASMVQASCIIEGIAPRFVATRSDAEAVAMWFDELLGDGEPDAEALAEPDISLLRGWRRELAGDLILAWLRGEQAVVATRSKAGLAVTPVTTPVGTDDSGEG